jgi:HD superfamily phosphohydrolase
MNNSTTNCLNINDSEWLTWLECTLNNFYVDCLKKDRKVEIFGWDAPLKTFQLLFLGVVREGKTRFICLDKRYIICLPAKIQAPSPTYPITIPQIFILSVLQIAIIPNIIATSTNTNPRMSPWALFSFMIFQDLLFCSHLAYLLKGEPSDKSPNWEANNPVFSVYDSFSSFLTKFSKTRKNCHLCPPRPLSIEVNNFGFTNFNICNYCISNEELASTLYVLRFSWGRVFLSAVIVFQTVLQKPSPSFLRFKRSNTFIDPLFMFLSYGEHILYNMGNLPSKNRLICECLGDNEIHRRTFQHFILIIFFSIENNKSPVYVTVIGVTGKMATQEFRDPLYRFIRVNPYELNIIESPYFKRLRYIHQLGLTYYVYPGAEHTRFEHSLGTMEIATKLFDILKEKSKEIFLKKKPNEEGLFKNENEMNRYRQILRVACLLHDIGHYPFSHGSEEIWKKNHEEMSKDVILSKSMRKRIEGNCPNNMDIKAEEISFIVSNKPETRDGKLHFLKQMLTGDLGVDRIDYLVRDSLHTGVMYGMFDYYRLLDTFMVYKGEEDDLELCLEKGGVQAAEGLILARYFMFSQVYYHKTRVAYDLHLKDYMNEFLSYSKKEQGIDYTKLENFLDLNDATILNQIRADDKLTENKKRIHLAKIIWNRNHHRIIREINGNNLVIQENPNQIYKMVEEKITKKFPKEVEKGAILFDRSMNKPTKFQQVFFNICDNGELNHIFKESELIRTLNNIDLFRVYGNVEKELERSIDKTIDKTIKKFVRYG